MRLKKLSILLKSSTSLLRLATVLFAACQRWSYHGTFRGMSGKTHYEKDRDSRKNDCGGGEHLKLRLGYRQVTSLVAVAHQADALAKCGRERAKNIHGRIEPLCKSLIAALRLIQFIGFPFKYGEDGLRRGAGIDLCSEWVGS